MKSWKRSFCQMRNSPLIKLPCQRSLLVLLMNEWNYELYRENTRNGRHGKTAQLWFAYVEMVALYNQFIRSIRMCDLDLYIHSLYSISSLFFTFNNHNYARWLMVCYNNLLKLQNTHPQGYEDFQNGCFAIKKMPNSFLVWRLTWRWKILSMLMLHVRELESVHCGSFVVHADSCLLINVSSWWDYVKHIKIQDTSGSWKSHQFL